MTNVKDGELKGLKIPSGDFFGDCITTTGEKPKPTSPRQRNECEAMRILNNKFNAENKYGITVTLQRWRRVEVLLRRRQRRIRRQEATQRPAHARVEHPRLLRHGGSCSPWRKATRRPGSTPLT